MIVLLAATIGLLFACGVYLILRRSMVRMIFGLVLISHAVNLLVFAAGGLVRGEPPLIEPGTRPEDLADPLPQALVLTSIVIGFGLLVFAAVLVERVRRGLDTDDPDALREEVQ